MNFENTIVSEKSQSQKPTYHYMYMKCPEQVNLQRSYIWDMGYLSYQINILTYIAHSKKR